MKLNSLHESGEPEPSEPWVVNDPWVSRAEPNPGVVEGDPCPLCTQELKVKKRRILSNDAGGGKRGGSRYFLYCAEKHVWDFNLKSLQAKQVADSPVPVDYDAHTCGASQRRTPENSEDWARRNRKRCAACAAEYDSEGDESLDAGFHSPYDPGVAQPGEVADLPSPGERRAPRSPGQFGHGKPEEVLPSDSKLVRIMKGIRDMGGEEWSRRGDQRYGVRQREKPICSLNHTCSDPSAPMPDPMSTRNTGPSRHNNWFEYNASDLRVWPISGLRGFRPKEEHKDFIEGKLACPVCSGKVEGCDNSVSTDYGKPKPFCNEHLDESPYPKDLMDRFGGVGLPGAPEDSKSVKSGFRGTRAKFLRVGDEVRLDPSRKGKDGTGELVGVITKIVSSNPADRTHMVKWVNPRAEKLGSTFEDPEGLDLIDQREVIEKRKHLS